MLSVENEIRILESERFYHPLGLRLGQLPRRFPQQGGSRAATDQIILTGGRM